MPAPMGGGLAAEYKRDAPGERRGLVFALVYYKQRANYLAVMGSLRLTSCWLRAAFQVVNRAQLDSEVSFSG